MTGRPRLQTADGFTLVELLIAVVLSAVLIAALVGTLLIALQTTEGLSATATVTKVQDAQLVGVQLDSNVGIQALTRVFAADVTSVNKGSNIVIPGSGFPCGAPAVDPSYTPGTDTPLATMTLASDTSGTVHVITYRYSTDSKQRYGQIVRYDCSNGVEKATLVVRGLSSTVTPSISNPSTDIYELSVQTATSRSYRLDARMRLDLNATPPSPTPTQSSPPPVQQPVTALTMTDNNTDGFMDKINATFGSATLSSSCNQGWSVTGAPSSESAGTVTVSGSTVTINMQGATGAADTSIAQTQVTFAPVSSCNLAGFTLAPQDKASPIVMAVTDTNGSTDGSMQSGDTMSIKFSEPIASTSLPANGVTALVSESEPSNGQGGNDTLDVGWPANSPTTFLVTAQDLGARGYVKSNKTGSCNATVAQAANSSTVVVTIAAGCNDGNIQTGAGGSFALVPAATVQDAAGNAAKRNNGTIPGFLRLF